jgi:hypothetical protein
MIAQYMLVQKLASLLVIAGHLGRAFRPARSTTKMARHEAYRARHDPNWPP